MTRESHSNRRNHRSCSRRNLLKIIIFRIIKHAIARTVSLFLLLSKSKEVAFPHTPVLPTCIVEFRGTGFMAAEATCAVFAGANHRGAGAEVMAVV
jgi:hypothetical protein